MIDDGAIPAFGRNHLWRWSPVRVARLIRVPLLLAGSSTDPTVPERPQMAEMKRVRPQTATMLLAGADESRGIALTHAFVTPAAYAAYYAAIARMLNGLVGRA